MATLTPFRVPSKALKLLMFQNYDRGDSATQSGKDGSECPEKRHFN